MCSRAGLDLYPASPCTREEKRRERGAGGGITRVKGGREIPAGEDEGRAGGHAVGGVGE